MCLYPETPALERALERPVELKNAAATDTWPLPELRRIVGERHLAGAEHLADDAPDRAGIGGDAVPAAREPCTERRLHDLGQRALAVIGEQRVREVHARLVGR